jgi:hypothetical protein
MAEILTLGASYVVDATTGKQIPPVVRALLELDAEAQHVVDKGTIPLFGALGFTSLPAPPDDNGHAEGVCLDDVGQTGVIVGARDTRCTDVYGKLKAGESAAHNTGGTPATRSRSFWKENCASTIVGNDMVFMMDRKNKKITLTGFGHILELSEANGITLMTKGGKTCLHLMENGVLDIIAPTVNLGGAVSAATPATAVLCGVSGMTGVPSTAVGAGVYIRP